MKKSAVLGRPDTLVATCHRRNFCMVAILHPVGQGTQIPIDRAVVLIGRSPECDVVIDFSSKISRMHCALVQVDADHYIRDLGSMNGVTVAGQKVEKVCKLTNGSEVMIGDVKYLFLENVATAPKAAKPALAAGRPMPMLIDDTAQGIDIDNVQLKGDITRQSGVGSQATRSAGSPPRIPVNFDEVELVDAEVVEAELIDDIEVVEDVDIIEAVEVIEDVEIVDVDVIEDVDMIENVEILEIDEEPPYRRPRRRR